MTAMRLLAGFNRRVTNPGFRVLARRVAGYANVVHTGRRSGRTYRTPVGITWDGDQLLVAVNYGRRSDWVCNVLAAERFRLEHRGREIPMDRPQLELIGGRYFLIADKAQA
ncbi:nitroreductase family deazaflavin-dependent oxidoreductase [Nocardia sp. CDC159]|uniref:Nitroreductase family deazaflavin-dependent oxidoreductase n=1 Tax=Nocardia pulmonis TaxID=2951408 RepID=A0A9X2E531_9NOCA|nr:MULTISPECIES: nitroreductase/quinone reductase family protein [Nocardia]MCM6774389.1 nitroreductase family deazaflavin-dependent oxidoreductase [Nocardia pulmonis]MCM6787545.1 nitroreductase family deazaflavin-dependent oxidoreductase [Nocardia sp. CDC159]